MRQLSIALLTAVLIAAPARAACPLPDPADCVYVDVATCGLCDDGVTTCTSSGQCFGVCVGMCDDGTTPCTGDPDCEGIFSGECAGLCGGDGIPCLGDVQCPGTCEGAAPVFDGSQANPFCQIQVAYDGAAAGDTILVLPGTYQECVDAFGGNDIVPVDKGVHLVADAFLTQQDNELTVVDATGRCDELPAIVMGGSSSSLTGFTVTGGTNSGIYGQGGVVITNNVVTGNTGLTGGGVYIYSAACYYPSPVALDISNNTITGNHASNDPQGTDGSERLGDGGGLYVAVREFEDTVQTPCPGGGAEVTIANNVISDNTINNQTIDPMTLDVYPVFGGGLYLQTATQPNGGASVRITQNTIQGNSATAGSESYGGGLWAGSYGYGGTESIDITENTITGNLSTLDGGGLSAWLTPLVPGNVSMRTAKNTVVENTALDDSGGLDIFVALSDFGGPFTLSQRVEQNLVSGNTCNRDGGGMLALYLSDRSADLADVSAGVSNVTPADELEFVVAENQFVGNTAGLGGGGAALYVIPNADPANNPATIQPAAATIDFVSNLVGGNTAENISNFAEVGGGLLALLQTVGDSLAAANIIDSTFVANQIITGGFVGGVEVLPFTEPASDGSENATLIMDVDRSVVSLNDRAGIGGTPHPSLIVPVSNTWSFGHPTDNFDTFLFGPNPPPGNFQTNPLVASTAPFYPAVCSPIFDESVCPACVGGAGFHHSPDANGDNVVDGLDLLDVAVAFSASENELPELPDVRYDPLVDLDLNGVIDGEDLVFIATEFGEVCNR